MVRNKNEYYREKERSREDDSIKRNLEKGVSIDYCGRIRRYFLIGAMFNLLRILALGIVVGYLYKRMYKEFNPSVTASGSAKWI